ncbi:hypothetical protein K439DRAFT_1391994 [Ramaria rubella]|nr:hypothetical protein K439DRAFT_1391994 [Ramaria rubella]
MAGQISLEVTNILSVWFEGVLYGLYCTLFFESVYVILKKKKTGTFPAKVFFGATLVMFVIATSHIAVNLYRLLRGYVWLVDNPGPVIYFNDLGRWENIAHDAINAVMTWIGDMLLIYRCFIVWDNNYYIIALPTVLLALSIVTNSVALHLFTEVRLGTLFSPALVRWMDSIYAIALAQNTITTGMIAYRIWRQDRLSQEVGLRTTGAGSRASLIPVVRIVVESAVIYVLTAIIIIILYARNNNFQFVIQEAIVPIIGIVFTLISVRLAMRSSKVLITTTALEAKTTEWRVAQDTDASTSTANIADSEPGFRVNALDTAAKPMEFSTPLESMLENSMSPDNEFG